MLYNGGASSSSVSHGLGRAADGGSILASPETPARWGSSAEGNCCFDICQTESPTATSGSG